MSTVVSEPERSHVLDAATADISERSNLTKQQLLIWLGQKLQPQVPLYNVTETFTLSGSVDRGHFQRAFQTLINSSDALRTVIEETDGIPQQRVLERLPYKMDYLDFSDFSAPQAAFEDWLRARWRAPFDFRERLFDSALAKLAEDRFVWYLKQHHIVADAWSVSLAYRYVSEFYERSLEGRLDEVVTLPRFQDYVRYEREDRASSRRLQAEAYWKTKLAEKPGPLQFYGRSPPERTAGVERISTGLGFERTQKLKALAARRDISGATEHASMFHILAALLFAYLYRISGTRRLSIGAPFHNRGAKIFRDTLGLMMETLPLQITVEEGDSFLSVIRKVRAEMTEIRPFRGVALANPPRHRSYDVLLNYYTVTFPKFHGVPARVEPINMGPENDALILQASDFDGAGNLALDFGFQQNVFNGEQRLRAMRHFLRILDAFVINPAGSLEDVGLPTEEERHRLLAEWNDTKRDYPKDNYIQQLFEEQAERTPDAVAVIFPATGSGRSEDERLTYRELNARANQLAHHLRKLEVGPETLVAICVERSPEMIVGILGILKAGGVYVPLDPNYPDDRLRFILEDSRTALVLTQQRLQERLARLSAKTLCLDTDGELTHRREENLACEVQSESAAYVIYTSGSTGQPKGVVVTHGALARHCLEIQRCYELSPHDGVLQFASLAFDVSLEQILPALISGASLVLRDAEMWSAEEFHKKAADLEITVANLPTAYWHQCVQAPTDVPALPATGSLRLMIVGGDAMSPTDLKLWRQTPMKAARLLNAYGPTEATITATTFEIPAESAKTAELHNVPIGRPLGNRKAYILDQRGNPTPIGVSGELHLGGAGLARGYLNRPELTAEKFISDPFSGEPGARLYKTGDLARYLPDGNIEFLGRTDDQVKVRGFRIEPGEIEAVLNQHPGLRDCVVVAREDDAQQKRLIAYVVPKQQPSPTAGDLRDFLRQRVPDYMLPSAFVFLEALPRTPHGKLDRRALPLADRTRPERESSYIAPRTEVENVLAAIWAEVLKPDQVGIHDNFFDLGGHSLLAIQVVSRVREAFQVEISLRSFFETPTVAAIAAVIQQTKDSGGESPSPKISPAPRQPRRMKPPL